MPDLVSVVIPTRRRPDTVVKSIRTVLNQTYDNVEVIVSNNGADLETEQDVNAIGDDRIRLVAPPAELSMSHHFEFAIPHARGEWIAVVGDDDGILPDGLERGLAALRDSGLQCLGSRKVRYLWPRLSSADSPPLMAIPRGTGWIARSTATAMREYLSGKVQMTEAPITYTGGIFSRKLYDKIRSVRDSFYQSQNPDIYSGFAFCSTVDSYILHRRPLFIAGTSAHSTGYATMRGEVSKAAEDENIPVHPALAVEGMTKFTFSMQAAIYESYVQSSFLRDDNAMNMLRDQLVATVQSIRAERATESRVRERHAKAFDWVAAVARQNGIDPAPVFKEASGLNIASRLDRLKFQAATLVWDTTVDPTFGYPLEDVYDAAQTARHLIDRRPSQLRSYYRTVARRLARRFITDREALA